MCSRRVRGLCSTNGTFRVVLAEKSRKERSTGCGYDIRNMSVVICDTDIP